MKAIYAFSGDPITYGHLDIVRRAAKTYEEVVVAIGDNPQKQGKYLFSRTKRLELATECLKEFNNVSCLTFSGLLGEYAYRNGFDVIVRGVRNNSDLEGELVQFAVNETLHPTLDTVFFPTRRELSHISSGVVKAIVAEGGDVSSYCPLCVKEALERTISGKFIVGVAGGIAAGKTVLAKRLVQELSRYFTASYISLDEIGHRVLEDSDSMICRKTRGLIIEKFGREIVSNTGTIDRKKLGKIVFSDQHALTKLNEIMHEPMMACLYEATHELPVGVIVLEGAILIEAKWTDLVNNNVILVDAPEDIRVERLLKRSELTRDDALSKIRRQISNKDREAILRKRIEKRQWGRVWSIDNAGGRVDIEPIVNDIVELVNGKPEAN